MHGLELGVVSLGETAGASTGEGFTGLQNKYVHKQIK